MKNKLITLIIILELSNCIANAQVSEKKPWEKHGRLKATKHCLVHADGTPFFWMAATAWALAQYISREDVIWYLDKIKANKFNVVQVFTANDWALFNMKNYYGNPTFDDQDATKLNKSYWAHLGWVIDQAAENFKGGRQVSFSLPECLQNQNKTLLISNYSLSKDEMGTLTLKPYEARIYLLGQ